MLLSRSDFDVYFFWAECLLFIAMICVIFMSETKDRSLNEIEMTFRKKTMGSQARQKIYNELL